MFDFVVSANGVMSRSKCSCPSPLVENEEHMMTGISESFCGQLSRIFDLWVLVMFVLLFAHEPKQQ